MKREIQSTILVSFLRKGSKKDIKQEAKKVFRRVTFTTDVLFYVKATENLSVPPAPTDYAGNRFVNCWW